MQLSTLNHDSAIIPLGPAQCGFSVLTWFLLQDLYQRCEKMRPTLFRLASDTEDNDEALGMLGGLSLDVDRSHTIRPVTDQLTTAMFPAHSGYLRGQRQPHAGHQSVQTAGEGGGADKR